MHFPHVVRLRTPKTLLASVTAAHVAVALTLFLVFDAGAELQFADQRLPVAPLLTALLLGVLLSLLQAVRALRAKRGMEWVLCEDGSLLLRQHGHEQACRLDGEAVDFGWALWLCVRPVAVKAARRPVWRWMLVPAELDAQDGWRVLRIWVRHKTLRPPQS